MEILASIARFLIDRIFFASANPFSDFGSVFDQFRDRFRKILILSLSALSCAALFVAGVVFSILGITANYEQIGIGDSRLIWGLLLSLAALTGFVFSTSPTQWREKAVVPQARNQALHDAIALAINEFVRQREEQRQQRATRQSPLEPSRAA